MGNGFAITTGRLSLRRKRSDRLQCTYCRTPDLRVLWTALGPSPEATWATNKGVTVGHLAFNCFLTFEPARIVLVSVSWATI